MLSCSVLCDFFGLSNKFNNGIKHLNRATYSFFTHIDIVSLFKIHYSSFGLCVEVYYQIAANATSLYMKIRNSYLQEDLVYKISYVQPLAHSNSVF